MAKLKGIVKREDGTPAAGAVINVRNKDVLAGQDTSAADGSYEVSRLALGSFDVTVEIAEAVSFSGKVDVNSATTNFDITLPPSASSAGAGAGAAGTPGTAGTTSPGGTSGTGASGSGPGTAGTPTGTGTGGTVTGSTEPGGTPTGTGTGTPATGGSGTTGGVPSTEPTGTGSTGTGTTGTGTTPTGTPGTEPTGTGTTGTGTTGTGTTPTGTPGTEPTGTGTTGTGTTGTGTTPTGTPGTEPTGTGTTGTGTTGTGTTPTGTPATGTGTATGTAPAPAPAPDPFADLKTLTDGNDFSAEPKVNIPEAIEFRRMFTVGLYVLAEVPAGIARLNEALTTNNHASLNLINKNALLTNNGAKIQSILNRRAEDFNNEAAVINEVRREFNLGNGSGAANVEFKQLYSDFVNHASDDLMGVDPQTLDGKIVFDAKEKEQVINFLKRLKRLTVKLASNAAVSGTFGTQALVAKWSDILKSSLEVLNDVAQNNVASDDADEKNIWSVLAKINNMPRSTVKAYVVHAKDGGTLLEYAIEIYKVIQDGDKLEDETDVYLRELFYTPGFVFKNPDRAAAVVLKPRASIVKENWALPTWS